MPQLTGAQGGREVASAACARSSWRLRDAARRRDRPAHSPLERPIGRPEPCASGLGSQYIATAALDQIPCHAHHHRVLHRLKLRAPGRQVGGRAPATFSRREGGTDTGVGRTVRGIEGRLADLPEVEARATSGAGRDRWLVARGSLTTVPAESDPGRCVVWTRWPVARPTPRNPSIIPHRCASQSPPAAATPRV